MRKRILAEFVRLHRQSLDPLLPPASASRARLESRLAESGAGASAPPPPFRAALPVAACILALIILLIPHRAPRLVPTTAITPGVARLASKAEVCATNPGKNREVPLDLRRRVFELYGIPRADPKAYEVDYLITPALGGAEDIGNLWPEPYSATVWNARVKDALEDRLHELVCRGDLDLPTAQREIASDWIAAYKKYFRTQRPAF